MMIIRRFVLFLVFLFAGVITTFSQIKEDLVNWSDFGVIFSPVRNLDLSITEEIRFVDNLSRFDRIRTIFGVNYGINKYVRVGGCYSLFEVYELNKSWSLAHRFEIDATGIYSFSGFCFSLREKFETDLTPEMNGGSDVSISLRSRLKIDYSIGKSGITPYVSGEIYNLLNKKAANIVSEMRYAVGCSFSFCKGHSIDPYFLIRFHNYQKNMDKIEYAIGLSYRYRIPFVLH